MDVPFHHTETGVYNHVLKIISVERCLEEPEKSRTASFRRAASRGPRTPDTDPSNPSLGNQGRLRSRAQGLPGGTDSGQAPANDNYIKVVHKDTLSRENRISDQARRLLLPSSLFPAILCFP